MLNLKAKLQLFPNKNLGYVTVFVFYFQKFVFGRIKKKQFYYIFEIKKHDWLVEIKKIFFEEKMENTKINYNANLLNETNLLN